jgi:hypothetical protein
MKKKLEEKEINEIFSNIEEIYENNNLFLGDLEEEYKKYPNSKFGIVFLKYSNFFEKYQIFVNNYDMSNEILKKNFILKILDDIKLLNNNSNSNNNNLNNNNNNNTLTNISSLLIMPVNILILIIINNNK